MVLPVPRKAWYFLLLLPFVFGGMGWLIRGTNSDLSLLLAGPILIAGPQYIIFITGFIIWGYNKTADQIWRLRYWLPFLFSPVCILGFWTGFSGLGYSFGGSGTVDLMQAFLMGASLVVFAFSYFYVLFGIGLTKLLTKICHKRCAENA